MWDQPKKNKGDMNAVEKFGGLQAKPGCRPAEVHRVNSQSSRTSVSRD